MNELKQSQSKDMFFKSIVIHSETQRKFDKMKRISKKKPSSKLQFFDIQKLSVCPKYFNPGGNKPVAKILSQ